MDIAHAALVAGLLLSSATAGTPAGSPTDTAGAWSPVERNTSDPPTDGPAERVVTVPLPPAVWSGLATLTGIAIVAWSRRNRRV